METESQKEIMKQKMQTEEKPDSRLAKRLCYVLRYGAMKEGLEVYEGGYVDLQELMKINLMRHNTETEVIEEVDTSLSHRGNKRFERKIENGKTLVRAIFCRRFEKNPFHDSSGVHTLLDLTLEYVSSNLDMYDLEDFPDEYLISSIIHRLKKKKKLNNANLRQLLVPTLEHLDLDGLYVTEGTLKTIWTSCPQLKVLSLKDSGYIVTDNLMEQLLKACIVLTLCDNNLDMEVLSLPQKYQCMVYYGNALYQLTEYMKAEDVYKKALPLKKAINKSKGKTGMLINMDSLTSDVDVKYKIYLCLSQMKQYREAMSVLEGISSKQRTAKVNLALAKLYLRAGMDRSAITSYKEVIRECPFALEAMQGLLGLGVKGVDVAALVMNGLPHGFSCDWLSMWIKGNALLQSREYTTALSTFTLMDSKTYLKDNVQLISAIAEARFYDGQYSAALSGFQRAYAIDPLYLKNMDLYSYLLFKEKKVKELENLSQQLMKVTEDSPEPWIAIGYYSLITRKANRAVYFAHKANSLDPFNIEAYLLKGTSLLDLKQTQDSALHIQEAMRLAPHRFEAYLGMINCYMASKRTRDSLTCAGKAIKTLGSSSRTLTLYASVLSKQQNMAMKAKPYLEKAMKMDPNFLEPVYIMAEILAKEHQYVKGIELLRKQLQTHSTCRLHQMLADFLTSTNEHQEALDQYSIALSLDPSNSRAKEGMERVEKHNDVGLENGYDVDVEDMENSDNENDYEFSDVESTWSETEFS